MSEDAAPDDTPSGASPEKRAKPASRRPRSRGLRPSTRGKVLRLSQPVIPTAAAIVIVYVVLFRLLHIFCLCLTFEAYAGAWLHPGAWGLSPLALAKTVNLLFLAYLALALAAFAAGPHRRNRARWVVYVAGVALLVLLQVAISRTGDLAWHVHYTSHGTRGRQDAAKRVELCSSAIELFPGMPISAEAHLGRANALRSLGRHERAVEDYTAALALVGEWTTALLGRSISLRALGRIEDADNDVRAASREMSFRQEPGWLEGGRAPDAVEVIIRGGLFREIRRLRLTEAVPALVRYLDRCHRERYEKPCAAYRAVLALAVIGDTVAVPALLKALSPSATRPVRSAAGAARARLRGEAAPAIPYWDPMCRGGNAEADIRALAERYLAEHPEVVERYDELVAGAFLHEDIPSE